MPFGNRSFERENIGHLSTENALADYARLILALKAQTPQLAKSPVVAFGGSYGGSLTAYFRMAYPEIVDIALAASAPILLYDGVTDSNAFFDVVRQGFERVDAQCPLVLQAALDAVAAETEATVQAAMALCRPTDANTVQLWARSALVSLVQLDYPTPASGMPAWPVRTTIGAPDCAILLKRGGGRSFDRQRWPVKARWRSPTAPPHRLLRSCTRSPSPLVSNTLRRALILTHIFV